MLARAQPALANVPALLQEFEGLGDMLQMPRSERCGILNVPESAYAATLAGQVGDSAPAPAELMRRMVYAVSIMRRMVANAGVVSLPAAAQPGLAASKLRSPSVQPGLSPARRASASVLRSRRPAASW